MNKQLIKTAILMFLSLIIISGCKKVLDAPSRHLVTAGQMWKVKNDARSAVFATYGLLRAALANNNAYFVYGEMRAGDFVSTSNADLQAVVSNNLGLNSPELNEWKSWRRFYAAIAQANLCLNKLPLVQKNDFRYTDDELRLDMANVRFVRALTYFYLVRIWGDVPLITKTAEEGFADVKRENYLKVLNFASQELLSALNDLPLQYNSTFPEQQVNYWGQSVSHWKGIIATKTTAYDLLAHIYAWMGDYLEVANYTGKIMDNKTNGGYDFVTTADLTNSLGGVFLGQADDIIFALPFNKDYQESSETGHLENWTLAIPFIAKQVPDIYINNDSIIQIFKEQGDERFYIDSSGTAYGNYFTGFGKPIPVFSKIKELSVAGDDPLKNFQSAIVIFRYEEVVLLRAEAMYFLKKNDDAIQLLNSVRTHRGLLELKIDDMPIADAILSERRKELLGEGWRWFDLIRFNKVGDYSGLSSDAISRGALLWPLSDDALAAGTDIQQNSFWQH